MRGFGTAFGLPELDLECGGRAATVTARQDCRRVLHAGSPRGVLGCVPQCYDKRHEFFRF